MLTGLSAKVVLLLVMGFFYNPQADEYYIAGPSMEVDSLECEVTEERTDFVNRSVAVMSTSSDYLGYTVKCVQFNRNDMEDM